MLIWLGVGLCLVFVVAIDTRGPNSSSVLLLVSPVFGVSLNTPQIESVSHSSFSYNPLLY